MDKSWISKSRLSEEYENGVDMFLDFAFNNVSYEDKIICPCVRCGLIFPVTRPTCYDHLMADGFMESYTSWILHGENPSSITTEIPNSTNNEPVMHMDTNELLHDAFGVPLDNIGGDLHDPEKSGEEPNESAKKFYDLLNDGQKELFPGSKNSTKLSFILEIFHIKCLGGWSNKSFTMLLELLHKTFPGILLPKTFYEVDKLIKSLGLGYEKIDACPNDCLLYRKEFKDDLECNVCHESRYLKNDGNDGDSSNGVSSSITTKIPAKVLHYFPLIPRLQRLFMPSKTASSMRWHKEGRTKDGCMRHPADSPAWKTFDHVNSDFSADCRNVRLGLASDGMNPFKTMSTTHSTWPVVLVHYNMEPSECLKHTNLIVSMIIPGPNSPGNNIDVYLQPLIDELQELWSNGVETYDASMKHNFKMRAALLWTISDFPGYAMLSGWSTKGKYACPYCHEHTCHHWLTKGRKHCYLGSRRFLDEDHPFRDDHKSFDGTKERRLAPEPLSGTSILDCLSGFDLRYGKTVSNPDLPFNWKKRSIFFQLPYWKNNLVRHNLDLMHNEKNICESAIGTLLGIPGKTKDNLNARLDMKLLEIRPELHPTEEGADKDSFPPACFSLNKEGKTAFCRFLKNVKVPDGYAANISRCVDIKHRRIFGLKSHDYHVLMQQLLPLSIRGLLPAHVTSTLTELSKFFRDLSSKVGTPEEFRRLERRIPIILCELEKIFPPSFFDIMVHLMLHLPTEARLAGPVSFRSMWFVERYLATLKGFVRNRNHPEGSIAKNYLANECMTFCSRYMEGIETRFNRVSRNYDGVEYEDRLSIFSNPGRPLGKRITQTLDEDTKLKAHRYVLFNCEEVNPFIEQHRSIMEKENPHLRPMAIERLHSKNFPTWFENHVDRLQKSGDCQITDALRCLAQGPNIVCSKYNRFVINGYRFIIKSCETNKKTQNSGVFVTANTPSFTSSKDMNRVVGDVDFYGVLTEIVELDYLFGNRVVLFKADWVSRSGKKQDNGYTLVNFTRLLNEEEPFVLASQVEQVMYVEDIKNKGWQVAIRIKPRDTYDMAARSSIDNIESYLQSAVCEVPSEDINSNFQ